VSNTLTAAYARLYQSLAEVLAEPPEWFTRPGDQWPLFADVLEIAQGGHRVASTMHHAARELAQIPSENLGARRARYEALFQGTNRPHLWLYESMVRDGRLAGPSTFSIASAYKAAGVVVSGTELPDHASVELAFLAYLSAQEANAADSADQWRRARRLFISHHAGKWLPALGRSLAQTQDTVYSPIGRLLVNALLIIPRVIRPAPTLTNVLPNLSPPEMCNLCSFCVQVCPTRALTIRETDEVTSLQISDSACVGCRHCIRICPTRALEMARRQPDNHCRVLRASVRAHCLFCGQPMISQAELEAVSKELGDPAWLNYCPDCRPLLWGGRHEFPR
jgi:ferredoxin/nitrate reductase assembly molybdenum cofactor insertion protein NarJ